jgi:hypothetical protein
MTASDVSMNLDGGGLTSRSWRVSMGYRLMRLFALALRSNTSI